MTKNDRLCKLCLLEIKKNQTQGERINERVELWSQIAIVLFGFIIPLVWLYPFDKIHKITRMFCYELLIMGISLIPLIVWSAIYSVTPFDDEYSGVPFMLFIIVYFGVGVIQFPFIVKWSREWNKKIDAQVELLYKEEPKQD